MSKRLLFKGILIIVTLFTISNIFLVNSFSATTDKDFLLDDKIGDSPQVIMKDQDENNLIIQKLDSGEANIINDEGDINLKPSGDLNNYFQMLTIANAPYLYWFINGYTNLPGFRVNPATGKLEYRDEDVATWVELDNLGAGSTNLGDLADVNFGGGPSQGDILYYNSLDWVNLPAGSSGQFLRTQGAGANPIWANVSATDELVKAGVGGTPRYLDDGDFSDTGVHIEIANDAINTVKILDANVTTAKIADSSITTVKIADANITTAKILNANVTTAKIADANVTTAKILNANVTTIKIADDAVTEPKLDVMDVPADGEVLAWNNGSSKFEWVVQTASTDELVKAGVGGTPRYLDDGDFSDNGTSLEIANDAINTVKILDANVTTAKIADSSITTVKIADANVTTAKILDANVTTAKILDANVTTAKIADSNVTTVKIADSNVTTAKILDANVTTAKVADDAVTEPKLDVMDVPADGEVLAWNNANSRFEWVVQTAGSDELVKAGAAGTPRYLDAGDFTDNGISLEIANDAIDTAKILNANVTTAKIADSSITTVKIADANVTTVKIADDSITTVKVLDSNITTSKIADANITTAKILDVNVTTAKIADANITTTKVADDAISEPKLDVMDVPADGEVLAWNNANSRFEWVVQSSTTDELVKAGAAGTPRYLNAGDFTDNGTSLEIANDAIDTVKILDANVTTAKIADANITTAKIADSGITTVKILDANVTTAKIADANVTTAKILDANVTTAKIADANVTTVKVANDAISEPKLDVMDVPADGEVLAWNNANSRFEWVVQTSATDELVKAGAAGTPRYLNAGDFTDNGTSLEIANDAIDTVKILDANVTTAKIADANITTAKIADSGITTVKILDANVTTAKIADANVTTVKIADANITTAKVADDAVTEPKLDVMDVPADGEVLAWNNANSRFEWVVQSSTTDELVKAGAAGTPRYLDAGDFTDNGTSLEIANDAIDTVKILDANVTTAKIADSSITTVKIADANVTTAKILDANVTTAKIADSGVTTAKIADSNVTTAKILDANVTTAKIADANITTVKIADANITTVKVANDAISEPKLDVMDVPADGEVLAWNNANSRFEWVVQTSATDELVKAGAAGTPRYLDAGDFTDNGTSLEIANDAIDTVKILDANVTTAKIADSSITTVKIADANVTTAKILDANVTTAKILDANVTTAKIADSNVTTVKIADANITTAKILDANVTTAKIADANVTTAKIADANITTAKILDANITTVKIADANITTAKVANDAVTEPKLDVMDVPADGEVLAWNNANSRFEWVDQSLANNTLDQAYDQGGAGAGRAITVDSGPVQLNASGTQSRLQMVQRSVPSSPADGDIEIFDTNLGPLQFYYDSARSKWLSCMVLTDGGGRNNNLSAGNYLRMYDGLMPSANVGHQVPDDVCIVAVALSCGVSSTCTVLVRANGTNLAGTAISLTAQTSNKINDLNINANDSDILAAYVSAGTARSPQTQYWYRLRK